MEQQESSERADSENSATREIQPRGNELTAWTDEKHHSYLSLMEQSFIRQFWSSEYGSNQPLSQIPIVAHRYSKTPGSSSNCSGQFKVLQRGSWNTINFESTRTQVDFEDETRMLFENPWIQHFTSRIVVKADKKELAATSIQIQSPNSKHHQPSCSNAYHHIALESSTEMSGQNFLEIDSQGEGSEKVKRRKRTKTAAKSKKTKEKQCSSNSN